MSETEENTEKEEEDEETELEAEAIEEKIIPEKACLVIPENIKPLVECCKDFEEGKMDSNDFFAKALIHAGEFMQKVKDKAKENEESE